MSSQTLRISRKLFTLALLVGAFFFILSERPVVVQATTCDSAYGTGIYTCTNQLSGAPPLCPTNTPYNPSCTVSYSYTDCQSNQTAVYDLCVLQNGPVGVTPLQPMAPPPSPTQPVGSIIYKNCINGSVPTFLRPTYNSCIAAGGTKSDCCAAITPTTSGDSGL